MRIKKYIAKSMREALLQIRDELGEDAIILKTSKLQKKMFGLAGPDEIEVTAAVDEDAAAKKQPSFAPLHLSAPGIATSAPTDSGLYGRPRPSAASGVDPSASIRQGVGGMGDLQGSQNAMPEPITPIPQKTEPVIRPYFPPRQSSLPKLRDGTSDSDEISQIKASVRELRDIVKSIVTTSSLSPQSPDNASANKDSDDSGWGAFVKKLVDSEVKPDIAKKLVDSIRGDDSPSINGTDAELEDKITAALSAQFPVSGPLKLKKGAPLKVAFVGPTGSGKTTTLAKLAAHCCFNKSKKISIITADTYRIAAIEQIRAFADIVSVGLQVVFSPEEVQDALDACWDSDVVFMDTAGRSQRNKEHMEELRVMMDTLRPDETHLVLSATTKDSDLLDMVYNYRKIKVNRLLFTKLDETSKLGNIFNVVNELGIPVSYFTVGQSVPDDIELAQAGKFVKRLMEGRAL